MKRRERSRLLYFTLVFSLLPASALAYIDPSVSSYLIQAAAGAAVAVGSFAAVYGRRMIGRLRKMLGVKKTVKKEREPDVILIPFSEISCTFTENCDTVGTGGGKNPAEEERSLS